jgi:hypothetical protein
MKIELDLVKNLASKSLFFWKIFGTRSSTKPKYCFQLHIGSFVKPNL